MPLNIDWQQILLHLLNFVILAFGLYILLYKPVKKFMKKRRDEYAEREDKTKAALDEAENKNAEYAARLASAEEEIASMKRAAAEELDAAKEQRLADAKKEADGIIADAKARAQEEHDKLIRRVDSDIRDIVNDMVKKVALPTDTDEAYAEFLDSAAKEDGADNGKNAR